MEASLTNLPILMYHHIASPPRSVKIRGLYVTPKQLDWQIRGLKQAGFEFINFQKLAQAENSPSASFQRPIILTFDDGYQDNYQNAFPILQKHGITAVIYPVVGAIGKKQVIWEENEEPFPVDLMTAEEIKTMSKGGVEFGSHLWHHIHVNRYSAQETQEQLSHSKKKLEEILGMSVLSVAYPFGAYNESILQAAAQAGYCYGVTTDPGVNASPGSHLALQRISVKGHKLHHRWYFTKLIRSLI